MLESGPSLDPSCFTGAFNSPEAGASTGAPEEVLKLGLGLPVELTLGDVTSESELPWGSVASLFTGGGCSEALGAALSEDGTSDAEVAPGPPSAVGLGISEGWMSFDPGD